MNGTDLDVLADRMLGPATRLVTAVHRVDKAETHLVLGSLSVLELRTVAVVLASLVPDDHALAVIAVWTQTPPPVSEHRAAENRAALEAELAADFQQRRAERERIRRTA